MYSTALRYVDYAYNFCFTARCLVLVCCPNYWGLCPDLVHLPLWAHPTVYTSIRYVSSGTFMPHSCNLELAYILFSYTLGLASTYSQTLIGAKSYLPIHTTMTSSLIGLSDASPEGMLSCVTEGCTSICLLAILVLTILYHSRHLPSERQKPSPKLRESGEATPKIYKVPKCI